MSKSTPVATSSNKIRPAVAAASFVPEEAKSEPAAPKRERKPRDPNAPKRVKPTITDELRKLEAKHAEDVQALRDAENKLEARLADVRRQREAAEGPLARIRAVIGGDGPGDDDESAGEDNAPDSPEAPQPVPAADPNALASTPVEPSADSVNQ